MKQIVLGISGASGAAYAQRLTQVLAASDVHVHVVISPAGRVLLADELGISKPSVAALVGHASDRVTLYNHNDIGAKIASGSFATEGMIVCPCSSNSLAAIAGGLADNLLTRAALVTLKESRRLVLVSREMPLSLIEIENMARLARAGAIVCPASPGFYLHPTKVEHLVDFVVGRVLDLFRIEHDLAIRWEPKLRRRPASGAETLG